MDFMFGLSKYAHGNTGIVVFVDRLNKMAHFADVSDTIDDIGSGNAVHRSCVGTTRLACGNCL